MDGVSWSTTRAQESFSRSGTAAQTLTRLASFIARAENKHSTRSQKILPPPAFSCKECGKGFTYASELLQHQELEHTLPKPHRCPSCGQEFSLRSSLQLHKCVRDPSPCVLCHGEPRLGSPCPACATCSLEPVGPKSPHRKPHHLDRSPYACAPCGRGFNQKQALLHHQQAGCSKPPSPLDTANVSGFPYDSPPVSEGDSTRSDSSDTPGPSSTSLSVCQFCSRTFRVAEALQRHMQTNHRKDMLRGQRQQKTKETGTGGEARRTRQNSSNTDPVKAPKSKNLLSCRSCDMVFRSTSKLYMHRREKHSREANVRREPRPVVVSKRKRGETYPCHVCGKLFLHHLSLKAHCRQHQPSGFPPVKKKGEPLGSSTKDTSLSETRPNKSKLSEADLKTSKAALVRPKKVVRAENKLGDADKYRKVPVADDEEELEELEEREFPCPSCAEVFSLQSQLKEHMELHQSSLKRRQCSVCTSEMDACKLPSSKRQRLYHCVPCQQGFSALDAFLEHCQEHLRVRVEEDNIMEGYTHHASKA